MGRNLELQMQSGTRKDPVFWQTNESKVDSARLQVSYRTKSEIKWQQEGLSNTVYWLQRSTIALPIAALRIGMETRRRARKAAR